MAGDRVSSSAGDQEGEHRDYQGDHCNRETEGGDGQSCATNPTGIASGAEGGYGAQDVANRAISLTQSCQIIGLPRSQMLGEIE